MLDQTFINALLGGFCTLAGFLLHAVWQAVKDLQTADVQLTSDVSNLKVLVAGNYVTREDFQRVIEALFTKLDKIEDKLDHKADKEPK